MNGTNSGLVLFVSFFEQALREKANGFSQKYEHLINELCKTVDSLHVGHSTPDRIVLRKWLQVATLTVGSLTRNSSKLIELLVNLNFEKLQLHQEYQDFVENLVSAQPHYCNLVMKSMISRFSDPLVDSQATHAIIQSLVDIIPSSVSSIIPLLETSFPHYRRETDEVCSAISNSLSLVDYIPALLHPILEIIVNQILMVDVEIQVKVDDLSDEELEEIQEHVFNEDENINEDDSSEEKLYIKSSLDKLDRMIMEVITFLDTRYQMNPRESANTDQLFLSQKAVFVSVLSIFESLKDTFSDMFLGLLAAKVFKGSAGMDSAVTFDSDMNSQFDPVSLSASSYMASFLSRAKFLDSSTLKSCFSLMLTWAERYVMIYKEFSSSLDAQKHSLFYSICQGLLYVFCFRHSILLDGPCQIGNGISSSFLKMKTSFEKIVNSKLNPLLVCLPSVVNEFAQISSGYNFVYCYSVIERNRGIYCKSQSSCSYLENFFPFDPYRLKLSRKYIDENNLYNEWKSNDDDDDDCNVLEECSVISSEGGEVEELLRDNFPESTQSAQSLLFSQYDATSTPKLLGKR